MQLDTPDLRMNRSGDEKAVLTAASKSVLQPFLLRVLFSHFITKR
jgi:hypothetical protein